MFDDCEICGELDELTQCEECARWVCEDCLAQEDPPICIKCEDDDPFWEAVDFFYDFYRIAGGK